MLDMEHPGILAATAALAFLGAIVVYLSHKKSAVSGPTPSITVEHLLSVPPPPKILCAAELFFELALPRVIALLFF